MKPASIESYLSKGRLRRAANIPWVLDFINQVDERILTKISVRVKIRVWNNIEDVKSRRMLSKKHIS